MSPTKLHSATAEWNINKQQTRQGSLVNFRNERKKTNHKQLDRAILKYTVSYLEQMRLICDVKLFNSLPKQGKRFQLQNDKNTPEAMADETTWNY